MDTLRFKRPIIGVSGLMAAFALADPAIYTYRSLLGLPTNLKCEAQISAVAREEKIPLNGSLRYDPWLRICHFKYYDASQGDVASHKWYPALR